MEQFNWKTDKEMVRVLTWLAEVEKGSEPANKSRTLREKIRSSDWYKAALKKYREATEATA